MTVNSVLFMFVFFFKQKTAYEMRISDWSSDVCSSDLNEINEYNREKFETEAVELFPGKSPRDVLALPFAVRKAAGIHHPYKLADIPFPHRLEQSHAMLFGTTGAGKTTQLRDLIVQMRQRQEIGRAPV